MPITREQFEAEGATIVDFLRTHADQAWTVWEIVHETGSEYITVHHAVANAGNLVRKKFMGGCEYFLYVRPEGKEGAIMAEGPQFWVRLDPNSTVKHFLVDVGILTAKFRTACGSLVNAYFPDVEGKVACPECLEYTRRKGVKEA